jgi:hypothetical protein
MSAAKWNAWSRESQMILNGFNQRAKLSAISLVSIEEKYQ